MCFSLNTSRYSKNVPCVVLLEGRVSFPEVLVVVKAGLGGGVGFSAQEGRERVAAVKQPSTDLPLSGSGPHVPCIFHASTCASHSHACFLSVCAAGSTRCSARLVSAALAVFCLCQSSLDLRSRPLPQ